LAGEKIQKMVNINVRKKDEIMNLLKLNPHGSIQMRASPEFIETLNLFHEKIKNNNKDIFCNLKPISIPDMTRLLAPAIKEKIIYNDNINMNIKKYKKNKKVRYSLEMEVL